MLFYSFYYQYPPRFIKSCHNIQFQYPPGVTMKSLSVVYNKNRDQESIKSSCPATQISIDKRNNVYISLGSEIRVFSLRRLSKMKDFIIDVIKMQEIITKKVELETDNLTERFNDPDLELIELKQFLVEDEECRKNKLLDPKRLKQRITHLNQQYLSIRTFQLSKSKGEYPNITVLLSTQNLLTIRNNGDGYRSVSKKSKSEVRAFKYLTENVLAVVTDKIVFREDGDEERELGRITLSQTQVNLIEVVSVSPNIQKIVTASFTKLTIYTVENYKAIATEHIKTNEPFYYLQASTLNPNLLHLASFTHVWSLQLSSQDPLLQPHQKLQDEKLLFHDSIIPHTTLSYKQNSITKLLIQSENGVYLSLSFDVGRSYKELDLIIAVPNQYILLKWCLANIHKSCNDSQRVLNFHDLRVIQNKQVITQLQKIALILKDNELSETGKDINQRRINKQILDQSLQVIKQLNIPKEDIDTVCQKLLLHILLICGEAKRETWRGVAFEVVKRRLGMEEIEPELLEKRCVFSYQKLKNDLLECMQCKLMGNKSESEGESRCYVCWGEYVLISQV